MLSSPVASPSEFAIFAFVAALCTRACFCDVKRREIPNDVPVLVVVSAVIGATLQTRDVSGVFMLAWLPALCFLIVGFVLTILNVWGAGDAKFLAALSLFCPSYWIDLIGLTALAGGVLAAIYLVKNRYTKQKTSTLPYGVAIASAFGILTMSAV